MPKRDIPILIRWTVHVGEYEFMQHDIKDVPAGSSEEFIAQTVDSYCQTMWTGDARDCHREEWAYTDGSKWARYTFFGGEIVVADVRWQVIGSRQAATIRALL
jgi:hypothetical protein